MKWRLINACPLVFMTSVSGASLPAWRQSLRSAKAALLSAPAQGSKGCASGGRLALAVGNMAGDLDSLVSALGAARLHGGAAVAAFPTAELAMRRDAAALFARYGVDARSEIVFLDELSDDVCDAWRGRLDVVLTDHNRLADSLAAKLGDNVVEILDHHADEGAHASAAARDIDTSAGSCCTLVAERVVACGDRDDDALLCMLLAAIAVDTRSFKLAKTSKRDALAVLKMVNVLSDGPPALKYTTELSLEELALAAARAALPAAHALSAAAATVADVGAALVSSRSDVLDLGLADLLRLDYKQAAGGVLQVGVASTTRRMRDLVDVAGSVSAFVEAIEDLAAEKHADIVFILGAKDDTDLCDGFALSKHKDLIYVVVPPASASADDARALKSFSQSLELYLERVPAGLPPDLAANPLFAQQRITERGFNALFDDFNYNGQKSPASPLRATRISKDVTRKTLMPTILHFCSKLAPLQP
ncbi:hypothetical protein M885DRAFT_547752 [Pelagophyceae sp. CCMP2097]|nr:hypothetical protein M885DRAFT_547752 [Pelagophyceae sp. CCMP2097]|mmetsp:Transcript_27940/g.94064  ORF Transcript_27940/g.94064 Transcript_27940/m.94064 type:complete len:477 (+) Transcript_27940:23-1453(+)